MIERDWTSKDDDLYDFDVYCDRCDTHTWFASVTFYEVIDELESLGWSKQRIGDSWENYCEECTEAQRAEDDENDILKAFS